MDGEEKQEAGQRRTDIQGERLVPSQGRKTIASVTTASMRTASMTTACITTANMSSSKYDNSKYDNSNHKQQQRLSQQLLVMTWKPGRKRRAGRMDAYWLGRLVGKLDSIINLINDALL